jgi:hypothetical protein
MQGGGVLINGEQLSESAAVTVCPRRQGWRMFATRSTLGAMKLWSE